MSETLIEVKNLKTWFPIRKGIFQTVANHVKAVDGVSFSIKKGETLSLVGESGCGKTTVGKTILKLIQATDGEVLYKGKDVLKMAPAELLTYRRKMQIIFQDPAGSMNPRMLVKDIIAEGIRSFKLKPESEVEARVAELLEKVELSPDSMMRYPHEFSGGQRQRICIARALAVEPEFIVCDEATSALDVSVQASILNLLKNLQQELGLTYLFITHDLSVVEYLSDRVAVMYLGQIVDEATSEALFSQPKHPYTEALLKSAPSMDPDHRELIALSGDIPSPINPPNGCRFHGRCTKAMDRCTKENVPFYDVENGRSRCLLFEKEK
jgi:oligopeptide/dipeptide ABC transporter ATP-binding protein